ncbi:putative glucuronoxylan glucuronosyltransferase IRX7 [Camellia lanceoleosa]|uniref:Glucuronoxylan glucuronosyltransferase IRX7 n=1 Tax=Camellia lanceoleosa TaxID=1840588 RepID=A0ACC0FU85_9ERIC|nr:putative glucuronoxylan glucuronosyltransferase IRX7 [Camellia lanceoleosa]
MAELNRASKNRGLYARMRQLHTTTKHHGRQTEKKTHCYRYLKWVLWFSLSSTYFLTSSLITHHSPTTSLSKTATVSLSKTTLPSRALFESLNKTHLQKLKTHPALGLFNDLKVYIYDLPSKYNTDWLSNERCSNHLFASEVAIHRALLNSDVRTPDPNEADFFFVPIYVSCNFSSINGFPAIGHARSLIESAVRIISSELPFWNRSRGSDHVFVASHDFGACFHTMEEIAIEDGIPEVLKKSIILQTFGVKHGHPCQEVENVVIPAYVSPESVRPTIAKAPAKGRRDIFVFFRGKMEVHPKNISGRFYSKGEEKRERERERSRGEELGARSSSQRRKRSSSPSRPIISELVAEEELVAVASDRRPCLCLHPRPRLRPHPGPLQSLLLLLLLPSSSRFF